MMVGLLYAMLLSILPIGELRAGIPYAIVIAGVHPLLAFAACVTANALVSLPVFAFLEFLHVKLLHQRHYRAAFDYFMERTRKRVQGNVEKYGVIGLALFVAVPLPVTGAYTGALAAWFFGMPKQKAFWSIALGVAIAGVIVTLITTTGVQIVGLIIG